MPIKKKTVKKAIKKVAVDRKFLKKLADRIYNPADRSFLRLCDGKLQNGPDPTDESRPMHCGLGELYFAMTGKQPEFTGVSEDGVVDLAVELSSLQAMKDEIRGKAITGIKKLGLIDALQESLIEAVNETDDECLDDGLENRFREVLNDIPESNDDGCGHDAESCTLTDFRNRSKRVASKLREAAKLLPV